MNKDTLPEVAKTPEFTIEAGNEFAAYDTVVRQHLLATLAALDIHPLRLSWRGYGVRVMWRLTMQYDPKLTNDEVRRNVWYLVVKGFAAYEPQFFKGEAEEPNTMVAVWFTDGADRARNLIPF